MCPSFPWVLIDPARHANSHTRGPTGHTHLPERYRSFRTGSQLMVAERGEQPKYAAVGRIWRDSLVPMPC